MYPVHVMLLSLLFSILLSGIAFSGAVWLMYSSKARSRLADNQGKVVALFMVIVVVGVVLILSSYNGILRTPLQVVGLFNFHSDECPFNASKCFYGIIFDAGSTGSRIHVYQFRPGTQDQPYELMDELFEFNSKGLSSYAKEPKQGAESLRPMLDNAKKYIPESQWGITPMALKATAGLRLLDKQDADNLLDEVGKLFRDYPFKLYDNPVTIMGGIDEGLFSWFTLNFLKKALNDKNKMMGVLDLGGGSTQITFLPLHQETKSQAPEGYLTKIKLLSGEEVDLYSHSYLGLGLMSGRFQMVGGLEDPDSNDEKNPDSFQTVCLSSTFSDDMKYNGKTYRVSGKDPATRSRYEECFAEAKKFMPKYKVQKPKEIEVVQFVTISYYYDRAVDVRLIEEKEGGLITLGDFMSAASRECRSPSSKKPYLCLDLCYIVALLGDGFGMNKYTNLVLRKKINNIEVTWGLGAIIEMFNSHGTPKPLPQTSVKS